MSVFKQVIVLGVSGLAVLAGGTGCSSQHGLKSHEIGAISLVPPSSFIDGESKWRDAEIDLPAARPVEPETAVAVKD